MIVWLNAWPMCRMPVTFGGGSWMLKAGRPASAPASKYPRDSQTGYQRASIAAGSKALASSVSCCLAAGSFDRVLGHGGIARFEFYGDRL